MNIGRKYFPISPDAAADGVIIILRRIGVAWKTGAKIMYGVVQNQGTSGFTFSAKQSDDNGQSDAYVAVNIRVRGSSVASTVVPAGGEVEFTLEYDTVFKTGEYVQFLAVTTGSTAAAGLLGLAVNNEVESIRADTRDYAGTP